MTGLLPAAGLAQSVPCPPNLDFEMGSFANWECRTGIVSWVNGINTLNLSQVGVTPTRHEIRHASATSDTDFYGGFPVICPNGSGYSVKLGNDNTGSEAESISYTYNIPAGISSFIILYNYAVVFQDPPSETQHALAEKPRFQARVVNVTDNQLIDCVAFDFFSSSTLPGFRISPKTKPDDTILYKDWTPVTLDLGAYAGKQIRLEFITSDCTRGGHFGYAYVDVNSSCNGIIQGTAKCSGETTITLTAPYGYSNYTWFSDLSYLQVTGSGQTLTLNPAPVNGAVLPLIIQPYPGFGCTDTLFATIIAASRPVANAGPDIVSCSGVPVQLGGPPVTGYTYQWYPPAFVSNTVAAAPFTANLGTTTDFVVKTTDISSGCFSYDTTRVTVAGIDTLLFVAGKLQYCEREPPATTLFTYNQFAAVQWFRDGIPLPGATGNTFVPVLSGKYHAVFTQTSCSDSTRKIDFSVRPQPLASFVNITADTQCVTGNSFSFTNTSSISNAIPLQYRWQFADGTVQTQTDALKIFSAAGQQTVNLQVTAANGCTDSTKKFVFVTPNVKVDFRWDSLCRERPAYFRNLSQENGNPGVQYNWDFGNGQITTGKEPLPVIYNSDGVYAVTLRAVAYGCEAWPQSIAKEVTVVPPVPGIRYPDVVAPAGYNRQLMARRLPGAQYNWQPSPPLSNNRIQSPAFMGVQDEQFLITITDRHTCFTVDTLAVHILTKPGFYIPSGFTPNGDGLNDRLTPYIIGSGQFKRFNIYNRNGALLFTSVKDGQGWDGSYLGVPQPAAGYVWLLEYVDAGGATRVEKGVLALVR